MNNGKAACGMRHAVNQSLTPREKEIMTLLSQGHLDKEMAFALGLSINTVKNHLKNIYHKLDVDNRVEAVIWYYNGCGVRDA